MIKAVAADPICVVGGRRWNLFECHVQKSAGITGPSPREANYWRTHQAPNVDSACLAECFAQQALPRLRCIRRRLSRLLGQHGSKAIREATRVALSLLTPSDWPSLLSYASEVVLLISRLWLLFSPAPQASCQVSLMAVATVITWISLSAEPSIRFLSKRRRL